MRSVTIIADDGLTTEGFSKTVFVLGVEEGLRFVESQPGVDAVMVDAQGALHYSSGLLGYAPQTTTSKEAHHEAADHLSTRPPARITSVLVAAGIVTQRLGRRPKPIRAPSPAGGVPIAFAARQRVG